MTMLRKVCSIVIFLMFLSAAAWADVETVTSVGRGEDKAKALENGIEEALRKYTGSLFLSREELRDDSFKEQVIQASRGSVKNQKILTEEILDNGLVVLNLEVQIDSNPVIEVIRGTRRSKGQGVIFRSRQFLNNGQNAISDFFENLDFLEFLEVSQPKAAEGDRQKGIMIIEVQVTIREDLFQKKIAGPMAALLDEVTLPLELNDELSDEPLDVRQAATFYIMGPNLSFKGWNLPKNFLDAFQRGTGLAPFGKTPLQTQKRAWLYISLLDAEGKEFQSIPVPMNITNILLFSSWGGGPTSPWKSVSDSQTQLSILCAPRFGYIEKVEGTQGGTYRYLSQLEKPEHLELHLPIETLARVSDVVLSLALE